MFPGFNLSEIEEHPLRDRLNKEFHARSPIQLSGPMLVSHLAFFPEDPPVDVERENVLRLCQTSACKFWTTPRRT